MTLLPNEKRPKKAIDNRTMLIFADLLFRWQTRLKLLINLREY